jgi:hypothetical protein
MSNLRDPFAAGPVSAPGPHPIATKSAVTAAPWRGVVRLVLILAAGGVIGFGVQAWINHRVPDSPDATFVTIGQAYKTELAKVYAHAWEEGAKSLDAGAAPGAALDGVAKSWDGGRVDLFEKVVTPEFSKVVPEGRPDKELTAADRAKLAAAWRGFAKGLGGGK